MCPEFWVHITPPAVNLKLYSLQNPLVYPQTLILTDIKNNPDITARLCKPFEDCLHRNFRCPPVREHKYPHRDAAECDAFQAVLRGHVQAGSTYTSDSHAD